MPELPEVETYCRYFSKHALGKRIARVDVRDERILGEIRRDAFVRKLKGRTFTSVRRHGKHLFARAEGQGPRAGRVEPLGPRPSALGPPTWLHLHFGMTGDLAYYAGGDAPRFAKIVFDFDDGSHLAFEDMRLFGLAELVDSPDAFIKDRGLGPDPLTLKYPQFRALLERRRGAIKSLLMAQEILAGLGNLYVDEMLYQTSIHPRRPVDKLSEAEIKAMYTTMRKMLREVIARHERNAELPARYLFNHREVGERCPRCGGTINRAVVFGRTTYFCKSHQR